MRVRTTRTGSNNIAVQVVERFANRTKIIKHIGSASSKEALDALRKLANQYIDSVNKTVPLFPELTLQKEKQHFVAVENLVFINTYHHFAYEFFSSFYKRIGFDRLDSQILKDLTIMRLVEPCSKQASLELLREYFGIKHGHSALYKELKGILMLKEQVEKTAVAYAKKHLSFDFSLVFYDVTTLYFESFKQDEDTVDQKGEIASSGLRKPGFSKDNKANQPQIVIGLIVTREGFPVSFEVFEGNTFEGKTFIPSIIKFKATHAVKTLTVVADAAMISLPNVESLIKNNLSYIVGARTANLKLDQIKQISNDLGSVDKSSIHLETERGLLVCDFSNLRYRKDKHEMEKQITKAQNLLERQDGLKRTKFIMNKNDKKTEQILNADLIEKTKLLLGIKGYYTNLTTETNETIINHYHSLWHVEKAFRIAKSDLQARPIFHHKRDNIEAHILIVFISLCLANSIELLTNLSIKKVKKSIWQIQDIEFKDNLTNKIFLKRMDTAGNKMVELWKTLEQKY